MHPLAAGVLDGEAPGWTGAIGFGYGADELDASRLEELEVAAEVEVYAASVTARAGEGRQFASFRRAPRADVFPRTTREVTREVRGGGSRRRRGRDVDISLMNRGGGAAKTQIFRGGGAATPRPGSRRDDTR